MLFLLLVGLFFIQACRGNKYMEGIDFNPFETKYVNELIILYFK